ncbi:unnamed protein product [Orchesella dallaii]|uniref:C2H2-type domain-containing protein n=1 Tax=Orchesella dallaii TaxID=48710 RepID=A0ABP1PTK0_9HEXA
MMEPCISKSITLEQLPKLSDQLLATGKNKVPIVNLTIQNVLHCQQVQEQNNNANRGYGVSVINGFTCSLCSLSVESGTSITCCRMFGKLLNSFTKGLPWSFHELLSSLTRKADSAATDTPLVLCNRCWKTVEYLQNCYEELQRTLKDFHETILRIRCFLKISNKLSLQLDSQLNGGQKDSFHSHHGQYVIGNKDTGDVKVALLDKNLDDDEEDRNSYLTNNHYDSSDNNDNNDEEKPSFSGSSSQIGSQQTGSHLKQRKPHLNTKNASAISSKPIRHHGGLTEDEYHEKRRAQLRGYYLSKRKPPLIGPRPLTAQSHIKLKRAEKLCLDSSSFPAKSNCGRKVPVIKLNENQYSYRNVQFSKVKSHVINDTSEMFCCDKCNHSCGSLNVMKKHIAKIHFEPDHAYKCSFCDKTFYYRFQLRIHEAGHTEKGMGVQCEECGMSFKYKSSYFNHRRIVHWGVKPFECETCKKKFGTRKDLRVHSVTHSSEKPNVCQYCGDTFKLVKSLSAHEKRTHAN